MSIEHSDGSEKITTAQQATLKDLVPGVEADLTTFFRERNPAAVRFATSKLGNPYDGEDAAQNAWVGFLNNYTHIVGDPGAYVMRSTLNSTHSVHRWRETRRRWQGPSLDEEGAEGLVVSNGSNPENLTIRGTVVGEVFSAIDQLPPRQREVMLLDLAGLRDIDMAEHLGTPVNTVRTRLYRARQKLQKHPAVQQLKTG